MQLININKLENKVTINLQYINFSYLRPEIYLNKEKKPIILNVDYFPPTQTSDVNYDSFVTPNFFEIYNNVFFQNKSYAKKNFELLINQFKINSDIKTTFQIITEDNWLFHQKLIINYLNGVSSIVQKLKQELKPNDPCVDLPEENLYSLLKYFINSDLGTGAYDENIFNTFFSLYLDYFLPSIPNDMAVDIISNRIGGVLNHLLFLNHLSSDLLYPYIKLNKSETLDLYNNIIIRDTMKNKLDIFDHIDIDKILDSYLEQLINLNQTVFFDSHWAPLCLHFNFHTKTYYLSITPSQSQIVVDRILSSTTEEVIFSIFQLDLWEHAFQKSFNTSRIEYITYIINTVKNNNTIKNNLLFRIKYYMLFNKITSNRTPTTVTSMLGKKTIKFR